jgi:hypothetical protein
VSRLLPAWALPGGDAPTPMDGDGSAGGGDAGGGDGGSNPTPDGNPQGAPSGTPPTGPAPPPLVAGPVHHPWLAAKRSLGVALRGGGGGRDYRRAARDYVGARGGSRRAAQSVGSARGATARLAGFLSNVSTGGFAEAVRQLGLASLAGRPAHDVMAAITNALAPRGSTLGDAAARQAIADTLSGLWEARGVVDGGLDRLETMTADDVRGVIIESVSSYIFYQWALELGRAIERQAVSPTLAIMMEGEMRQYIRDTLQLDLASTDVLSIDWGGAHGQEITAKVYAEAFALIESK